MKCDHYIDLIIADIENDISLKDKNSLQQHLTSCENCKKEYKEYKHFLENIQLEEKPDRDHIDWEAFLPDLQSRLKKKQEKKSVRFYPLLMKLQTAAILILSLGLFSTFWQSKNQRTFFLTQLDTLRNSLYLQSSAPDRYSTLAIASSLTQNTSEANQLTEKALYSELSSYLNQHDLRLVNNDTLFNELEKLSNEEIEMIQKELTRIITERKK